MKAQLKNYLSLTKKEWNGMLVLVILIIAVLAAPYVYQWYHKDNTINAKEFDTALAQLNKANPGGARAYSNPASQKPPTRTLFKFNPNNLPAAQWKLLGLSDKQISILKNYEAKGGRFYKSADLKKIYGITDADYKALEPYIDLPETEVKHLLVELNTADSAKLTSLDGIGPAFAKRIIYYRERLGGFINKEQLTEVYGLDELKYAEIKDQLKVDASRIRKIDINTISFDKLRLMPYLDYKQVNAIIEYRNQHGNFTSVADLKNIAILNNQILQKITPYLVIK
ncbi:helix-hairpin-helix domain-containing protein [Mucilaginibacter sp. ZT4R22]|uniref:Helix-hairpin-helix domain-containing protein n=1 Tax=Mucilaginibacter pankratovii TaxID=2772110 RepID=A0ABR7WPF2_9SPHI|nr:helix-hairpin-helix domain-containing protein [Mucilaginibacter pankratovii]MBD1364200.1 helix-hairpin-helix domain-containing protein [Mucilaginibacter pankratovii]